MSDHPKRAQWGLGPDEWDRVAELHIDDETLVLYARGEEDAWLQSAAPVSVAERV